MGAAGDLEDGREGHCAAPVRGPHLDRDTVASGTRSPDDRRPGMGGERGGTRRKAGIVGPRDQHPPLRRDDLERGLTRSTERPPSTVTFRCWMAWSEAMAHARCCASVAGNGASAVVQKLPKKTSNRE